MYSLAGYEVQVLFASMCNCWISFAPGEDSLEQWCKPLKTNILQRAGSWDTPTVFEAQVIYLQWGFSTDSGMTLQIRA